MNESTTRKKVCSYCGEAPVNHTFYYIEKLIFSPFDSHMASVSKRVPLFLKKFVDWIPIFIFKNIVMFGLGHFSEDIDKANSFRSRVIWEEARRRGIYMRQIVILKRALDWYCANINGRIFFFESIPIQSEFIYSKKDWDNKIILKQELGKHNIPVPEYARLAPISARSLEKIFSKFKERPMVIKPASGSRARHTVTNIRTFLDFKKGVALARQISPYLVVEEHLEGYICRATVVGGILIGFYRGSVPKIIGDGKNTIRKLIEEKNKEQIDRYYVRVNDELLDHIARCGFGLEDVLPNKTILSLSHRAGQLFGGQTKEMIDDLHLSFIPIIEKAARIVGLPVLGFDCIIPDPTQKADSQKWGIIECNTLPFIDVHYYALEGKPRNIAGRIWDLWN